MDDSLKEVLTKRNFPGLYKMVDGQWQPFPVMALSIRQAKSIWKKEKDKGKKLGFKYKGTVKSDSVKVEIGFLPGLTDRKK